MRLTVVVDCKTDRKFLNGDFNFYGRSVLADHSCVRVRHPSIITMCARIVRRTTLSTLQCQLPLNLYEYVNYYKTLF